MLAEIETLKTVTLTLTESEAVWLRNVMQNPLHGQDRFNEDSTERAMRSRFFNALKEV